MNTQAETPEQDWLELALDGQDQQLEIIEEALFAVGALAVSYQASDEHEEIFEPPLGSTPLWQRSTIIGLFAKNSDLAAIVRELAEILGENLQFAPRFFADREWTRAWLDYFRPIRFGTAEKRFYVAAMEHEIEDAGALVLRLDPGLAFGTGTHPSTALCLQYLSEQNLKGKILYDYGCGSGILGMAAALLGAERVYQTDIDPQALQASRDNALKNGLLEKIEIVADPNAAPAVDVLVANILLAPLCALRPQFERHSHGGTEWIFAGLLAWQEEALRAAYQDYRIERLAEREGWIALRLRRS